MTAGGAGTTLRRQVVTACIAAGLVALAGLLALGLPGALVLEAATPVAGLFTRHELAPDQVWPAAIGISVVGPFALVPAYLMLARLTASRWLRVAGTLALTLLADVLCSVVGLVLAAA